MANLTDQKKTFEKIKKELNNFQLLLHVPDLLTPEQLENASEEDLENNVLHTPFYTQIRKSGWYYKFPEQLSASSDNNNNKNQLISYRTKNSSHILCDSDIVQHLPSIICQEGYKAKWCWNIGSNIVSSMHLSFNDVIIQSLDYRYNDLYGQTMIDPKTRDVRNINLGNISALQTFNEKLPSHKTSFRPPWHYNKDFGSNFPLLFTGLLDVLEHKVTIRQSIEDLLIVQDINGNQVKKITNKCIKSIDGHMVSTLSLKLQLPEMWGQFAYKSDFECDMDRSLCNGKKNTFLIEDVIMIGENSNPVSLNTQHTINIIPTEFPIHRIGWVAQNQTALKNNSYSNYSTDAKDLKLGNNPFEFATLNIGNNNNIFENMPSYRNSRVYTNDCSCSPIEPGYNIWSTSTDASSLDPCPGILFKNNASLNLKLEDTNPYLDLCETEEEREELSCKDYFKCFCFLTYYKQITFDTYPDDEASRINKRATISITGGNEK
jgi:hypothetical protein